MIQSVTKYWNWQRIRLITFPICIEIVDTGYGQHVSRSIDVFVIYAIISTLKSHVTYDGLMILFVIK